METGAGSVGPEDGTGHAGGLLLLSRLTEKLCALGCMEDAQGRLQFAGVLGDELGRTMDLRGIKLREDVVALVRAALNVAGGERVLADVVAVFEGPAAGAELDALLDRMLAPPALPPPPGPLSREDEISARAVLAKADVPGRRLRDELAEELNLLDLPAGLSSDQLITYVMGMNVQPDGLPPAVVLVDRAARLAPVPAHRAALADWVEDWVGQAGLRQALDRRRDRRAEAVRDPDIPRCLIIAVEPAGDGSGEFVVRPWLNMTPGLWAPQPGEPVTTTLDGLGGAVGGALRLGAGLWPTGREHREPSGLQQQLPYIEFVLPYDLLNHDMAGLTHRIGDGRPMPLSLRYGVHLRSLERMRAADGLVRVQWEERWRALREHGVTVHSWREPDGRRIDAWQRELAGEVMRTAVVLDAPADALALEALKAAIAEGVGLAIWDRRGVFAEERREVVTAVFAAALTPNQIPLVIHRLRRNAESQSQGPGELLGRHVGFLWDDPTRIVDFQPIDPGDLASEEAPA
ncbi:hypothetical protein ACFV19_11660 [Streptomyces griseoluteus]|uniref:VMAP-C domain-containing protein n=1 Tax=Streptomyces griseoluteus TaxID=29306 RepID=UPI00369B7D92